MMMNSPKGSKLSIRRIQLMSVAGMQDQASDKPLQPVALAAEQEALAYVGIKA